MMMDASHKHMGEQNEQANAGMRRIDALRVLQLCVCVCARTVLAPVYFVIAVLWS